MLTRFMNFFALLLCAVMVTPAALALCANGFYVTVTSGSMVPTYRVGDVLLVTRNVPHDLMVRQIVVINPNGTDAHAHYTDDKLHLGPFVHRIVATKPGGRYITRGDANHWSDPGSISKSNVEGTPVLRLTGAAAIAFRCVNSWPLRIGIIVSCVLILLLAAALKPSRTEDPAIEADLDVESDPSAPAAAVTRTS